MNTAQVRSQIVLGVVIGTFQRPDQLERTLAALSRSSKAPGPVFVVDSSSSEFAQSTKLVCERAHRKGLDVTYTHTDVKSVNVQRNIGIKRLLDIGADFIQVLDDDTAPEKDFLRILSDFLVQNPEAAGVSGVAPVEDIQSTSPIVRLAFVIAGLDSYRPGSVSLSGVGIPIACPQEGPTKAEWLIGCSMWRASVFQSQLFDETLRGSCLFDDVDFSIRARNLGSLSVICDAVLDHSMSPSFRPDLGLYHYRFSRNRWLVMRSLKAGPFRHAAFLSSVIFMELYLLYKWVSNPLKREEYWDAMKQNLLGYLGGVRNTPPK